MFIKNVFKSLFFDKISDVMTAPDTTKPKKYYPDSRNIWWHFSLRGAQIFFLGLWDHGLFCSENLGSTLNTGVKAKIGHPYAFAT